MEQEDGVRKELGDILRQNLMETGGVSVDRFRELLDNRYEEYFKRWDRDQDYPEKTGESAIHIKQEQGKFWTPITRKNSSGWTLKKLKRFEDELDQLNEQLSVLINRQKEKEGRVRQTPAAKKRDQPAAIAGTESWKRLKRSGKTCLRSVSSGR